jgi:hypothetical protein
MKLARRLSLTMLLMVMAVHGRADEAGDACPKDQVEEHVRQQFAVYGPLSTDREYFGFIYVHEGVIGSAITRSRKCERPEKCLVDSRGALASIPRPARVLGEWHTHPHKGSRSLSVHDVRGAHANRHLGCYFAFYSTPSGEIYAWNAREVSVPVAMASRARVGNYNDERRSIVLDSMTAMAVTKR